MAIKRKTKERIPNYPSLFPEIELLDVDTTEIEVDTIEIDTPWANQIAQV